MRRTDAKAQVGAPSIPHDKHALLFSDGPVGRKQGSPLRESEQRSEPVENPFDNLLRSSARFFCPALSPIQALEVISQNHSGDRQALG